MKRYHLNGTGIDALELVEEAPPKLGALQVLIRVRATSLNQRDLMVTRGVLPVKPSPVPLSDGAGEVMEVGSDVTRVARGDRVVAAFRQGWIGGPLDPALRGGADLGAAIDGMLGEWAVLDQEGVVKIPDDMSFEEAACFPCAGVTAWSALMVGEPIRIGQTVLVQGTGGVSLFALQTAHAAGLRVIATTSSPEKAERLKAMGADSVVDYRQTPQWGDAVRALTGGLGVDRVVEVGGAGTLAQSMSCTRLQGRISLVGLLDSSASQINPMPFIGSALTMTGISVGSRTDLERMLAAFDRQRLKPVIDRVFPFAEAREAFRHLDGKNHFGKVVIKH